MASSFDGSALISKYINIIINKQEKKEKKLKNHNGMLKPGSKVLCKPGKSQSSYSYKETDIIQYFVTVALQKIIPLCHGMAKKLNEKGYYLYMQKDCDRKKMEKNVKNLYFYEFSFVRFVFKTRWGWGTRNIILYYLVPVYTTYYYVDTSIGIECAYWESIMKR